MRNETPMRKLRKARGQSIMTVARETGLAYSTVQALDEGRGAGFSIEFKKKIAEHFGLTPGEFFELWPEELRKVRQVQMFIPKGD